MRAIAVLGLVAALTACRSAPREAEEPGTVSRCGRYELHIRNLMWWVLPGYQKEPLLAVRGDVAPVDSDSLLANVDFQWVTKPEERKGPLFGGIGVPDGPGGGSFRADLQVIGDKERIGYLRVECRFLRVLSWTEHSLGEVGPGESGPLPAPPYQLSISGDAERLVAASGVLPFTPGRPPAGQGLDGILGPAWAGRQVAATDAAGRRLVRGIPPGPEGGWSAAYAEEAPGAAIAYPVHLSVRIPDRYYVESVFFDVDDLRLPPAPDMTWRQ